MFTFTYNKQVFVLDSIAHVWNLIGASSLYRFSFKKKLYRLPSYFKFEKTPEGVCVSFCEDLLPTRRNIAYEIMSSLLITYSHVFKLSGLVIKTKVCGKAKMVFASDIHEERVIFKHKIDVSSFQIGKYVTVDLPYNQAAQLLLAQEYQEPLVHPDYCTVRIDPENIKSFIIV